MFRRDTAMGKVACDRSVQLKTLPMRPLAIVSALALGLLAGSRAEAQDPPRPIGPYVVDVRGTVPRFPKDLQLAQSRGLAIADLPGAGLGIDVDAHVYVLTWKAVTFGLGGQLTLSRSHSSAKSSGGQLVERAVTEKLTHVAPQISFNFGTGDGWSYLSGGIGPSVWSVVPDDAQPLSIDDVRLTTINYGGGARWFITRHVAFTFDVRFYAITPSEGVLGFPGSPRTTMMILGAGVGFR
jgi:hypothetical protein